MRNHCGIGLDIELTAVTLGRAQMIYGQNIFSLLQEIKSYIEICSSLLINPLFNEQLLSCFEWTP